METEFRQKVFDYCKEAYFFQFDRREKINGRIGVLLAIIAIAANMALKYLDDLPAFDGSVVMILFYVPLSGALILGLGAIYNMCKAVGKTLKWKYAPNPKPILDYIDQAEARNKQVIAEVRTDVQAVFENNLIRQFADSATVNDLANDTKNRHLLTATWWTIATMLALIVCAPSFYYLKFKVGNRRQKVEVVMPIPTSQ
jgi:hypothetical protein